MKCEKCGEPIKNVYWFLYGTETGLIYGYSCPVCNKDQPKESNIALDFKRILQADFD